MLDLHRNFANTVDHKLKLLQNNTISIRHSWLRFIEIEQLHGDLSGIWKHKNF